MASCITLHFNKTCQLFMSDLTLGALDIVQTSFGSIPGIFMSTLTTNFTETQKHYFLEMLCICYDFH